MAEAEVHTLQTGWCRYAGQDAAKRTNVWLLTQARIFPSYYMAVNMS